VFRYWLAEDSDQDVTVAVHDAAGNELMKRSGGKQAGLHEVVWNPLGRGGPGGFGAGGRGGGRGGDAQRGPRFPGPGQFQLRVTRGETTVTKGFWVRAEVGYESGAFGEENAGEHETERDR
jgi:hypothetical protein